jgi:RNA recognition motif-containing protein
MNKLFVVGLPRNMGEMELAQLFAPYGDIRLLTIVRDKFKGESKGYGFVHMADEQDAQAAIGDLNGYEIEDRKLEVRFADHKPVAAKQPVIQPKINSGPKADFPAVKKKRPRLSK